MNKFDNAREEWFQDPPFNLVELHESSAKKYGDCPSLGIKDPATGQYVWMTFKERAVRIDNLRGGLAQIGIDKDDKVAVITNNCVEFPIISFATYGRGAWFIPMYETELPSAWEYIMNHSETKAVFVANESIRDQVLEKKDKIPSLEKVILINGQGENTLAELEEMGKKNPVEPFYPKPSDIAGLIYTSGTTGAPKGVLLSHGNYCAMLRSLNDTYDELVEDTRTFGLLPWAHVFGQIGELYFAILLGAAVGIMANKDEIVQDIGIVKPTTLIAVPRIFNMIYNMIHAKMAAAGGMTEKLFIAAKKEAVKKRKTGKASFKFKILDKLVFDKIRDIFGGRLEQATTGSAVMNNDVKMFFQDLGIDTFDCYGLTESTTGLSFNSKKYGNEMGTVGKPGKFITIKIDRTLTGEDSKDGEIIAYGPNIMQGYYKNPEKTAEVMTEDGGFKTGDKGWLDKKGFLHISGRIKEEYKLTNGKYVHPAAIEEEMKLNPLVVNCYVSGAGKDYNVALIVPNMLAIKQIAESQNLPTEDLGALLKLKPIHDMLVSKITAQLTGIFGKYEIPKKFIFHPEEFSLESGLLTQTLKLKRNKIIDKFGKDLDNLYN
ncbi:MAG: AMP-binding protein [archaeon]|nr:AMP-binding protein [archaeon]